MQGEIKEKQVQSIWEVRDSLQSRLGTKVLQIFLVSTEGSITLPLCSILSTGGGGKWMYDKVSQCITNLQTVAGLTISWGSSDAFSGFSSFLTEMKTRYPNYFHFFDYIHLIKLARNQIRNTILKNSDCSSGFSIRNILTLWEQDELLQSQLSLEDIYPTDVMNVQTALNLMSVIGKLPESYLDNSAIHAASIYFQHWDSFYTCFHNNKMDYQTKCIKLKSIQQYFQTWHDDNNYRRNFISTELFNALTTTINNFLNFGSYYQTVHSSPLRLTSILGTNVVENYFSIIRRKIKYPNFWEYCLVAKRAWIELVKKFSKDCPFKLRDTKCGKKYNNQHGLTFFMTDISFLLPTEKTTTITSILSENQGSQEDKEKCLSLTAQYPCSKKKLLIREATCKINPTKTNKNRDFFINCQEMDCTKTYRYKGNYFFQCKHSVYI
jgi:hypothetical protein